MDNLLIAGVGNVLNSDDAFGPKVLENYMNPQINGLTIMETGIGGINIIQEMLKGYEGLIIIDAYQEGLEPGTLRVLEPEVKRLNLSKDEIRDYFSDTHYATPEKVLHFLKHTNNLPKFLRILACEPLSLKPCTLKMSKKVSNKINEAVKILENIVTQFFEKKGLL
ncbi:MAG: hypothetical protein CMP43_04470 [Rickettsiales bacterium]|nr:hypothetical protein [Rickettsiales bacterium]